MASNPPGECCARGFMHEGNPAGEIKDLNGTQTYFAYPSSTQTPDQAILFLSDIMGVNINSKLLSDSFAANGYLTMLPDLFHGNPWTLDNKWENLSQWIAGHTTATVDPVVEAAIKYLREKQGIKKIAAVGYCFGAKFVCRFMKPNQIDVGFLAHPSFVSDEELAGIHGPLSIAAAEIDTIFTTELRHKSEEILQKTGHHYQVNLYGGVEHGFAARGDLSDRKAAFGRMQAFTQAVTWFKWHL